MRFLKIIKDGIENAVDEAQFEKIYKPAGWTIADEITPSFEIVGKPDDEVRKKNINKMKRVKEQSFDDGLLKNK